MTRICITCGLLALVAGSPVGCNSAQRDASPGVLGGGRTVDEPVTLEEVPASVRRTIEAHLKGGRITELERSRDGERTVYEVEITGIDGKVFDLFVGEDGAVVGMEDDGEDEDGVDDEGAEDDDGPGDDDDDDEDEDEDDDDEDEDDDEDDEDGEDD